MRVAIGSIVRNRAWVLPDYLSALQSMQMIPERGYLFIENDSEDETQSILSNFADNEEAFARVALVKTGVQSWDHHQYDYANLASLRNRLLEWFLTTGADFLMSVDSDVIVQPDTFEKLCETYQSTGGIVGASICNVPGAELDGHTPGNFMILENGAYRHPTVYPMSGAYEVDLTGAVYLIPRWVIEQGARYDDNSQGEDVPFCASAKELGCPIHMNMDAQCEHRMVKEVR
jgi:hypothetical protein